MLKFPLRESSFSALTLPLPEIAPAALSLSAETPPVMRESPRTASLALRLPEISDAFAAKLSAERSPEISAFPVAVSFPLLYAFPATVRLSAVTVPSKEESEPSASVREPAVRVPVMSAPFVTVMLPVPPVAPLA